MKILEHVSLEAVHTHTHTHTHTDSLNKRTILLNMQIINKDSKYNPGDDSGLCLLSFCC